MKITSNYTNQRCNLASQVRQGREKELLKEQDMRTRWDPTLEEMNELQNFRKFHLEKEEDNVLRRIEQTRNGCLNTLRRKYTETGEIPKVENCETEFIICQTQHGCDNTIEPTFGRLQEKGKLSNVVWEKRSGCDRNDDYGGGCDKWTAINVRINKLN